MSQATEAQLAAAVVGILVTIAWRLIDRYLPDPNAPQHPTPPPPPPPTRPTLPG